jgi:hypothetical protein
MIEWKIMRVSPRTRETNSMTVLVHEDDYQRFLNGSLIQDCFRYLSDSEREFILTGYTQEDRDALCRDE